MTRVNLIPESVLAARTRRRRIHRWGLAVACALSSVLLTVGAEALQYRRVRAMEQEHEQMQNQLKGLRGEVRALTIEAAQTMRQLEHAEALRTKRAWSGIFAMLASCLPADCWLTSLGTDPAVPPFANSGTPPATPLIANSGTPKASVVMLEAPRRLHLAGYAPDPASPHTLVQSLKATNLFSHVTLNRTVREPTMDGLFFRFELDCEW